MLAAVERARAAGATVLTGGTRLTGPGYDGGYFVAPTIIEHVAPDDEISRSELFGPITCLYRVQDFDEAHARSPTTRRSASPPRSTRRASTAR